MDIKSAQQENRRSFVGGGPGVVVSGLVWLAAALVLSQAGTFPGFATLFIGGMLITPITTAVERMGFRRPAPSRENGLVALGLETAIAMIAGLLAASLFLKSAPEWVFPVAAMAVGTRYFSFATIYENKSFYVLGGLIAAIGAASIWGPVELPVAVPFAVAATEITFGLGLTLVSLRSR
ncbi:MAG: hypothetical protein U5J99_03780 [Parvularculaceae bacterium]|nr:hypothetical protein [Parvularculaceae bacterium]